MGDRIDESTIYVSVSMKSHCICFRDASLDVNTCAILPLSVRHRTAGLSHGWCVSHKATKTRPKQTASRQLQLAEFVVDTVVQNVCL